MTVPSIPQLLNRPDFADRIALVTKTKSYTYAEVAADVDRVAAGLWAMGVRRGDRVCFHFTNQPRFIHLLFATWKLGAMVAFVDVFNSAIPRLIEWCNFIDPKCLIIDESRMEASRPYLPELETCKLVFSSNDPLGVPGVRPWSELLEHGAAPPPEAIATLSGDDRIIMYQTSGTTARAKGIWHTVDALDDRLKSHMLCPPFSPDDLVCPMSPLSTVAGLNATCLPALAVGAPVMLFANAYDPAAALEQIAEFGGTIVMAGPARIAGLLQVAKSRPDIRCDKLRFMMTGGDKMPEALRKEWDAAFGVPLLEGYGLSETLGGILINRLGEEATHAGNCGKPFPRCEIRLVGEDGKDVADGEAGELWCKADFLFGGYWEEPERTAAVLVDGWFKTGDYASRDGNGDYRILGRRDYLILRGTICVSPLEVETVIGKYPAIEDCMASGFPSEKLGQEIEAFLVLREPLAVKDLEAFLAERLGPNYAPTRFWSVPEIPRTGQGKVDRKLAGDLRSRATLLQQ